MFLSMLLCGCMVLGTNWEQTCQGNPNNPVVSMSLARMHLLQTRDGSHGQASRRSSRVKVLQRFKLQMIPKLELLYLPW